MIRHEGLGELPGPLPCEACSEPDAIYRCLDCVPDCMLCQHCIVAEHRKPMESLHNVQVMPSFSFLFISYLTNVYQRWTGDFFTGVALFELGATYQLGHRVGRNCTRPSTPVDLTLFDICGVVTIRIHYCYCGEPGQQKLPRTQLLRMRWFPATLKQPGTAFTFRLLNSFHKLQTKSKVNLYDYYASLVSILNPAGLRPPIVSGCSLSGVRATDAAQYRYNEFTLVFRLWVDLRRVRRGGGAHICGRFDALTPGSLAIDCPACPHPGKNMITSSPDQ